MIHIHKINLLFCISSCSLDSEDTNGPLWLEEMIPDSTAYLEAGSRPKMSSEIDDRSDGDSVSHVGHLPLRLHDAPMKDDSLEEDKSEDADDGLTEQTPSWLKEMIPDSDSSADSEEGTDSRLSGFVDYNDDTENGSDRHTSLPMHASSNDSLEEYESDNIEDELTGQTHSSWLKEMIPGSANLEAGKRRSICEFGDGRDDADKDSHDELPSMPLHDASVDDDSLEGYESEDTEDELAHQTTLVDDDSSEGYESEDTEVELAHQTASTAGLVDQSSQ